MDTGIWYLVFGIWYLKFTSAAQKLHRLANDKLYEITPKKY